MVQVGLADSSLQDKRCERARLALHNIARLIGRRCNRVVLAQQTATAMVDAGLEIALPSTAALSGHMRDLHRVLTKQVSHVRLRGLLFVCYRGHRLRPTAVASQRSFCLRAASC